MPHPFRQNSWSGTLENLIESELLPELPSRSTLERSHEWIECLLAQRAGLYPVRRKGDNRGKVVQFGAMKFVFIDNEPFSWINEGLRVGDVPGTGFLELFSGGALPLSRHVEFDPSEHIPGWRAQQVDTELRRRGLKLAHLVDAGRGESPVTLEQFSNRFRRTMSPANIMPFPSSRCVSFRVIQAPIMIRRKDLAEEPVVQRVLLAAMRDHAGDGLVGAIVRAGGNQLRPDLSWRETARRIELESLPKDRAETERKLVYEGNGGASVFERGRRYSGDQLKEALGEGSYMQVVVKRRGVGTICIRFREDTNPRWREDELWIHNSEAGRRLSDARVWAESDTAVPVFIKEMGRDDWTFIGHARGKTGFEGAEAAQHAQDVRVGLILQLLREDEEG
ncbi:hypothetical protein KYC5002_23525 [Archangium violaceum]|uniref:hypothetical protein n=1 Tax=Archangium violaceum TaxID=83451 RepID=UPI002B319B9D|nr:hypothetical protein KYC5002_23525 [Archangium gephyra]